MRAGVDHLQTAPAALLAVPYRRLGSILARQTNDHLVDGVATLRAIMQHVETDLVRTSFADVYHAGLAIDLHVADLEPKSRPASVQLDHLGAGSEIRGSVVIAETHLVGHVPSKQVATDKGGPALQRG
ncbi:hypothetical protein GCM10022384_22060 [Streptomyces marokkonensis]|uniref:Uncharacterized protein n=1 Tax=Streptomyces marokkonensis TaxID=324855 RepID=A0ABP7PT88_9ACTN